MNGPAPDPALETREVDDAAVGWFIRKRSGAMSPHEARALEAWLEADPAHQAAFDAVAFTWSGIEPIRSDPRILALRERSSRRRWLPRALAACLAVGVIGGGVAGWSLWPHPGALSTQSFRTGVGERATVTLPDGSTVTLNTNTVVRTRADRDRRLVYLERGQAYFQVAHDRSHPFVVAAAGRTVTAVGTAFDVRIDGGFKVTLTEGKVRVAAPLPPAAARHAHAPAPRLGRSPEEQVTEMVAGTELVASDDQHWSIGRTDVAMETAWVRGQLVFVDEPLSHVAAEMNRYSDRKILVDPDAERVLISGTFKPGDVPAFVDAAAAYHLVSVASRTPGAIRLAEAR